MTATITINPAVDNIAAPALAKALGLSQVTNEQVRVAWVNYLRTQTANLYVRGDELLRKEQAEAPAQAALAQITGS